MPRPTTLYTSAPKRQKIPKDAAIFTDAKVNGPVNFPAYDIGDDEELASQHRRFQVYPMGNIQKKGARRIPYNSEKKDFMEKTGRDAFEGIYLCHQVGMCKLTVRSFPVRVQVARGRESVQRAVGLSNWPRSNYAVFQVLQVQQG
jgi:hypothetical protein